MRKFVALARNVSHRGAWMLRASGHVLVTLFLGVLLGIFSAMLSPILAIPAYYLNLDLSEATITNVVIPCWVALAAVVFTAMLLWIDPVERFELRNA